jgi:hypothetical protein
MLVRYDKAQDTTPDQIDLEEYLAWLDEQAERGAYERNQEEEA